MRFRIVKFSMHGQIAACAACPTPLASWTVTNETIAALNYLRLAVFSKRLENKFGVVCSRSMLVLVNVIALTIIGIPCGSGCFLMTGTSLFVDIQLPTVSIRLPTAVETPLSQAYSEDFVSIVHLWNNI